MTKADCSGFSRTTAGGGIRLRLVAAHAPVRHILRAEGMEECIGYFGRRIGVADVIDEFQGGQCRPRALCPRNLLLNDSKIAAEGE